MHRQAWRDHPVALTVVLDAVVLDAVVLDACRLVETGILSVESVIKLSTLPKPDERYGVAAWVSATQHDRKRSGMNAGDPA